MIVQETDKPEMRVYNVRHELTNQAHEDGHKNCTDDVGLFGKLLLDIPGIEVIRIQPYRFFISKAVMYEWSEIEPKIVSLIQSYEQHMRLINSGD